MRRPELPRPAPLVAVATVVTLFGCGATPAVPARPAPQPVLSPPPPPLPDRDGDGFDDADDKCPTEPEDGKPPDPRDGCPNKDLDGDGIPIPEDQCPDQPETVNGYEDTDGCPDEPPVVDALPAPTPSSKHTTAPAKGPSSTPTSTPTTKWPRRRRAGVRAPDARDAVPRGIGRTTDYFFFLPASGVPASAPASGAGEPPASRIGVVVGHVGMCGSAIPVVESIAGVHWPERPSELTAAVGKV